MTSGSSCDDGICWKNSSASCHCWPRWPRHRFFQWSWPTFMYVHPKKMPKSVKPGSSRIYLPHISRFQTFLFFWWLLQSLSWGAAATCCHVLPCSTVPCSRLCKTHARGSWHSTCTLWLFRIAIEHGPLIDALYNIYNIYLIYVYI